MQLKITTKDSFKSLSLLALRINVKSTLSYLPSLLVLTILHISVYLLMFTKLRNIPGKPSIYVLCNKIERLTELSVVSTSKSVTKNYPGRKPYLL